MKATSSVRRILQVKKENSAFVYAILESHEGWTAYSTLESPKETPYRRIELLIAPDFEREVTELIEVLGDLVVQVPSDSTG